MSLRLRIVALIGLVLLVSVMLGAVVAGYDAKQTLRDELQSALTGGDQTVRRAFEDLPRADHAARDLRQLVATFDENRHVRAVLVDAVGREVAASRVYRPAQPAPSWFISLLGQTPRRIELRLPVILPPTATGPAASAIRLEPIVSLDAAALWREFSGVVTIQAGAAATGLVLVFLVIGAAVRPLHALSEEFVRIGAGDYEGRVAEAGPPELIQLERAFNAMAERLAAMDRRNAALEAQLIALQDEERADLARDLHDEMGPHLFSVNIDAEIVGGLLGRGRDEEVRERLRAIQGAVGRMQRLVREILGRLRPTRATELGLNAAIADLVVFWRARRPDIAVTLDLAHEAGLAEPLKDTIYRVVQEALSNAMRHADATRVEIAVALTAPGEVTARIADDGARRAANPDGGLGLVGMRERVRASGGTLRIDEGGAEETGWTVTARLPIAASPAGKVA
jgi:two-component system sensor histidine kinase UhpB